MPVDFTTLTTPSPTPGGFTTSIPDTWQQGRGAFGGLVIATLVRALEAAAPASTSTASAASADRRLRSLTAELCGPVLPGPADITVDVLRHGTGVTTSAARLAQAGETLAQATAVFGRARADRPRRIHLAPPSFPAIEAVPVATIAPPFGPTFAQHLEFRNAGPAPFSSGPEGVTEGWVRLRAPGPVLDPATLAALADAWWPTIFSTDAAPRPIGTIAFTLDLIEPCGDLDPRAPLYHRARIVAEDEGYFVESRELWSADGRLLALNQQTFAVIR